MKKYLTSQATKHAAIAAGVGLGVFLGEAAKLATNSWVQAACGAGIAMLGALGISVAKSAAP